MYDYDGSIDGSIPLKAGQLVTLSVSDEGEEWWEGSVEGGKEGFFPANYVSLISDDSSKRKSVRLLDVDAAASETVVDSPAAPRRESLSLSNFRGNEESVVDDDVAPAVEERVQAVYDYEAANDGELTFKTGDYMKVISKTTAEDGWWLAKFRGKEGLVPSK